MADRSGKWLKNASTRDVTTTYGPIGLLYEDLTLDDLLFIFDTLTDDSVQSTTYRVADFQAMELARIDRIITYEAIGNSPPRVVTEEGSIMRKATALKLVAVLNS